jgi:hypothetical protein
MRRLANLALATALTLGLVATATHAAKPKKVKTEAEIELLDISPGGTQMSGDVHSRKPRCEKQRDVAVIYTGSDPGVEKPFGTATTDRTGDWSVSSDDVEIGPFVVEVERKRVGQGPKTLVCKRDTSPEMSFPEP